MVEPNSARITISTTIIIIIVIMVLTTAKFLANLRSHFLQNVLNTTYIVLWWLKKMGMPWHCHNAKLQEASGLHQTKNNQQRARILSVHCQANEKMLLNVKINPLNITLQINKCSFCILSRHCTPCLNKGKWALLYNFEKQSIPLQPTTLCEQGDLSCLQNVWCGGYLGK